MLSNDSTGFAAHFAGLFGNLQRTTTGCLLCAFAEVSSGRPGAVFVSCKNYTIYISYMSSSFCILYWACILKKNCLISALSDQLKGILHRIGAGSEHHMQ